MLQDADDAGVVGKVFGVVGRIDDDGLEFVAEMRDLELLCIRGTNITDDGLRKLRTLTKLESLNLCDTNISDSGLKWLDGMPQLREVLVSGPGVDRSKATQSGIDALRVANPNLKVKCLDSSHVLIQ